MPTFFERMRELANQELENIEPEIEIDRIKILKEYHDCLYVLLDILKNNHDLMLMAQQVNLYDQLIGKFNETKKLLNENHQQQIANKRN